MNKLPEIDIYNLLIQIPLYKQRGKEEVFLGIRRSKFRKWIGWKLISELKRNKEFPSKVSESGLYKLALNFWIIQSLKTPITLTELQKSYNI